jgi:hypothetical protein
MKQRPYPILSVLVAVGACIEKTQSGSSQAPALYSTPLSPFSGVFCCCLPPFYPFQHGLFTHRLSTPFLMSFSHKPFRRGVYDCVRKFTVSGGGGRVKRMLNYKL